MKLPSIRLTIRRLMVAVAMVALLIATFQKVFFYNNEPDRSLLSRGNEVVVFGVDGTMIPLCDEPDFATMKRDGYIGTTNPIDFSTVRAVPAGTKCLVICDFAGDRDDCSSGDRRTIIEVVEGQHAGLVAPIRRWFLRPR